MARFYCLFPFRTLVLLSITAVSLSLAQAQITNVTDDTSTPIPGAGHDYIHLLSETVNPANGSVSLRIQVPIPKGRGMTLPFSFGYDSDSVHHLIPGYYPNYGTVSWVSNLSYFGQGGWSFSVPMASVQESEVPAGSFPNNYTCERWTNYMFADATGGQHPLPLGTQFSAQQGPCPGSGGASGDGQVGASLPATQADPYYNPGETVALPVTVFTPDGTVYKFPTTGHTVYSGSPMFMLPTSIEDRNGNIINVIDNGNGAFAISDTAGRVMASSDGFGPVGSNFTNNLSFSGFPYVVTWKTTTAIFSTPSTPIGEGSPTNQYDTCTPISGANDSQNVISTITIPSPANQPLKYTFYYGTDNPNGSKYQNPYGLDLPPAFVHVRIRQPCSAPSAV